MGARLLLPATKDNGKRRSLRSDTWLAGMSSDGWAMSWISETFAFFSCSKEISIGSFSLYGNRVQR